MVAISYIVLPLAGIVFPSARKKTPTISGSFHQEGFIFHQVGLCRDAALERGNTVRPTS
jgi:hypothetical protein